jgi:hypothetical protein
MFAVRMLLIPLAFSAFLGASIAQAAPGRIEEVGSGTLVKVSRAGANVRLKKGDELKSGDEVTTDASTAVDIRLEDETLIRVGINSAYRIQEDSKINALVHRLLSGVVRVLVPKSETKSNLVKFRLYTPEGTIGVRGTEFVVIRTDGKTQLKGLDGNVLFGPAEADFANESLFVSVSRGFSSTVLAGAKAAGKAEKFDLNKYLLELGAKGGLFGPLSARAESARTHLRADNAPVSAPPPAASAAKAEPKEKEKTNIGSPKGPEKDPTNYQTMLLKAAAEDDVKAARLALKKGADIDGRDDVGYTALQIAMTFHKDKMISFLILEGANVNVKDKDGFTPLMLVAREKLDVEYGKLLVDPGAADPDAKDKSGLSALDHAKASGYTELAAYLASQESIDDFEKAVIARNKKKK